MSRPWYVTIDDFVALVREVLSETGHDRPRPWHPKDAADQLTMTADIVAATLDALGRRGESS